MALKEKQSGYLPIDAFASDDLGGNASIPFVGTLTYRVVVNPIVDSWCPFHCIFEVRVCPRFQRLRLNFARFTSRDSTISRLDIIGEAVLAFPVLGARDL